MRTPSNLHVASLFLLTALSLPTLTSCKGGGGGGTTAPAVPASLTADGVAADQVDLTWGSSFGARLGTAVKIGEFTPVDINKVKGYSLQRAEDVDGAPGEFTEIAALPDNITAFSDTGLVDGTRYWYQILAAGAGAKSAFTPAVGGITPMNAPTNVQSEAVGPAQIDITWEDNSASEEEVIIERAPDDNGSPGTFAAIGSAAADATLFSDTTVNNSSRYHYQIKGANQVTESDLVGGGNDRTGWSTRMAGGQRHALAIRSDGTVWGWGDNSDGQIGDGNNDFKFQRAQVQGINNAIDVATGFFFSLVLKADGKIMAFGSNNVGQLGDGTNTDSNIPVEVSSLSNVNAIAAGSSHGLALKNDGTVWAWGYNANGELGDGTNTDRNAPVQVSGLTDVVAISAGQGHNLALKADGSVWSWGFNSFGQVGDGTNVDQNVPVEAGSFSTATQVSAGFNHSLVLKTDGTVSSFGFNGNGELGDGTFADSNTPVDVSGLTQVDRISAGDNHNLASRSDGTYRGWGDNPFGEIGDGTQNDTNIPLPVLGGETFLHLDAASGYSLVLKKNGDLFSFGNSSNGTLGLNYDDFFTTPQAINAIDDLLMISAGDDHTLAVKNDGTAWTWGDNAEGELGQGTPLGEDVLIPGQVAGLTNIIDGEAGDGWTIVLGSDGLVRTWGVNTNGQIGDGTTNDRNTPYTIAGLTNITDVDAGEDHALALKNDGTVWAWGKDDDGQLGDDGLLADQSTPVQVSGLNNIIAIAAGEDHSFALRIDGTVWSWGEDDDGQLGDDIALADQPTPVQVSGLTGITFISAGFEAGRAIKNDGTVWTWGDDADDGQGDGAPQQDNPVPVMLTGITNPVATSGGLRVEYILLADGTVLANGDNDHGELGNDDAPNDSDVPILIPGLTDIVQIVGSFDGQHAFAIDGSGQLFAWGDNDDGQTGIGYSNFFLTPQMVIAPPLP